MRKAKPLDFSRMVSAAMRPHISAEVASNETKTPRNKCARRGRRAALIKWQKLWATFDSRLRLDGILHAGRVIYEAGVKADLLAQYWAGTFSFKPIDLEAAGLFINENQARMDFSGIQPPDTMDVQNTIDASVHSAPGRDGLPFAVWSGSRCDRRTNPFIRAP
jgi:hypothetical protein